MFLEISQNLQENTCARDYVLIKLQVEAYNFIKKETVAQVFSREFCEISKNTFFHRTPPVSASELLKKCCFKLFQILQIEYIIYKKTKTCIANALNISLVSSAVIFLTTIEYGTSSSSIDSNGSLSGFFHVPFVDG